MHFGINHIPATTANKIFNKTLTTTPVATLVSTTSASNNTIKYSTNIVRTEELISCNASSNNDHDITSNSTNLSNIFTTPQNCFEILTSIQNNPALSDCGSALSSSNTACETSTRVLADFPPSLSSASNAKLKRFEAFVGNPSINRENCSIHMDGNEENFCCYFERKLNPPEELTNQINSSVEESFLNTESLIISPSSSISNSYCCAVSISKNENFTTEAKLNRSQESEKEQSTQNSCCKSLGNIELQGQANDLSSNERKIAINSANILSCDKDSFSKSSVNSGELLRAIYSPDCVDKKKKNISRLSKRAKKKSWYNVLYPNYKSRSLDFRKLFKEVPNDERLIVDYSCAFYKDLLIQGRLYISQNYVCFHANIFGWETCLIIKFNEVTSITKEKTALVIPNAISICTPKEKFFFSSFTARDKTFLLLFRVWQNTLMNKLMPAQEIWQLVHNYYGDELGLTTDDDDYIDPTVEDREDNASSFDFVTGTDSNSFSVYEEALEQSIANSYQPAESSSGSGTNSATSGDCINLKTMKTNAKEFIANQEDAIFSNSQTQKTSTNSAGSVDGCAKTTCNISPSKETKQNTSSFDSTRKMSKSNRQWEENTNSETLPTDVSDSSDSEQNNIPFVATTECNSPHEGRQLVHTILPINIETLFNLLFSKSKFLLDFHSMRKSTDLVFSDWITNEDGQKKRTFNVTVQLAASVGPKTSKVTEFQVMRDCSKPGELYSIDINNVNAGIPYADSFSVLVHYCLVKTVDDHTMLSVHAQIKYKKSIWGVVKGFIEKNAWAGLDDFYTSLLHSLQSETCIPPAKGKGRRPRKGTAAQIRPQEEMPILQTKPEPSELCSIAQSISTHHSTDRPIKVAESTIKFRWLSMFVLVLLFFLIILNIILLIKLWKLEERIEERMSNRARIPNLSAVKQWPNSHEDWIELLRQQEVLHETELKKWHTVLQTAIELLKKVSVVCQNIITNDRLTKKIYQISDEL